MANEIKLNGYTTGVTLYAVIENVAGQVWRTDTTVFEAYTSANIASYAVSLSEAVASTGRYRGNFPTGISAAGRYNVSTYQRVGGSPAITDTYAGGSDVEWKGTAELSQASDINATANTINTTANTINTTANTINTQTSAANQQANVVVGATTFGAATAAAVSGVQTTATAISTTATAVKAKTDLIATNGADSPNATTAQGQVAALPSASANGTAAAASILATPGNKLATASGGGVTASTVSDKTGYTVSTVQDKAGYALTASLPAVDGSGRVILQPTQTGVAIPTVGAVTSPVTLGSTDAANIAASASQTTSTNITNAAIAALTAQGYTVTRAGKLDNADVATSTRGTFSGGAVASVTAPVTLTSSEHTNIAADASSGVASIIIEPGETFEQTMRLVRAILAGNSTPTGNVIMFTRADGTTGALTITTNPTTGARSSSTPGTL